MPEAISNTSPLLYLYRIEALDWLPQLFSEVWTASAVVQELQDGERRGYTVPDLSRYFWLQKVEPQSIPSELAVLALGAGETAVLALGQENPTKIVLLDDGVARQTAKLSGLIVWGTLKILLEAKSQGLTERIEPLVEQLARSGMWMSADIRRRILTLANE